MFFFIKNLPQFSTYYKLKMIPCFLRQPRNCNTISRPFHPYESCTGPASWGCTYSLKYMANIDFNFCTNGQWSRNRNRNSWGNGNGNKNGNKQANRTTKTEQTWLFAVSSFFSFSLFVTVVVVVVALALTTKCTWISIRRSVSASIGSHGSCPQLDSSCSPSVQLFLDFRWRTTDANADWPCDGPVHFVQPDSQFPFPQFLPQIKQTAVNCKIYWLSHPNAADI